MPILLMTLRTPLPSALMRFATAFSGVMPGDDAGPDEVLDALHRQVRVDGGGAVADEQRDVVHLADVAGLDEQPDLGPGLLPDEVVVDRAREQQRRDRRELRGRVAVGEHDEVRAVRDGRARPRRRSPRAAAASASPPPATRYRPLIVAVL